MGQQARLGVSGRMAVLSLVIVMMMVIGWAQGFTRRRPWTQAQHAAQGVVPVQGMVLECCQRMDSR